MAALRAATLGCSLGRVSDPFELLFLVRDPDHSVARVGNLVLVAWVGETRAHDVRAVGELLHRLPRKAGEQVGLLQIVTHAAKPPDQDTREALIDLVRGGAGLLAASAVVYPGDGFIMAAARAFVSGVAMLARPGFSHRVFPTRSEASEWISRLLPRVNGHSWTAHEVIDVVEDFVARASNG